MTKHFGTNQLFPLLKYTINNFIIFLYKFCFSIGLARDKLEKHA